MKNVIVVFASMCLAFLMVGCSGSTIKEKNKNDAIDVQMTEKQSLEMSDRDIINSIYDKLPSEEKDQVKDLDNSKMEIVTLSSEDGIGKVNEDDVITGIELYKVQYITNDEILGDLIVYAAKDDLTICGYGLRD
jgi:hypothetical protein